MSRSPCVIGPSCGHYMHKDCFEKCLRFGQYKCPMCQKPLVALSPPSLHALLVRIWQQVGSVRLVLGLGLLLWWWGWFPWHLRVPYSQA